MLDNKFSIFIVSLLFIILIYYSENKEKIKGKFEGNNGVKSAQIEKQYQENTLVSCVLDYIIDGDTVIADCDAQRRKIRLLGIDAPEMGQAPWGMKSRQVLIKILPESFTFQFLKKDFYNRDLGILISGKEDINLAMIKRGAAVAYLSEDTPKNYFEAEKEAKSDRIGLWQKSGSQQDPKNWRRHHL